MTPENQEIRRILEPVLAEVGITWTELLLADSATWNRNWSALVQVMFDRERMGMNALFKLPDPDSATLRAAIDARFNAIHTEWQKTWRALNAARKIRIRLNRQPFP